MTMIHWLLQGGSHAPKHTGRVHPVFTFLLHYASVSCFTILSHDWMVARYHRGGSMGAWQQPELKLTQRQDAVATFLSVYFIFYFSCRLALRWRESPWIFYCEWYQQTFLCSVTIFNAALSLYTQRPILASAFCVAVGIDQLLWYVDLLVFAVSGKFPIGVTKYLFWPGTSWASRMTSTHHLWTIPLITWATGRVHPRAVPLSVVVVLSNVLLSRCLTPHSIVKGKETRYLNLNMSYELWPDIQIKWLRAFEDRVPYLLRLVIGWSLCNSVVFGIIFAVSSLLMGPTVSAREVLSGTEEL